MLVLPSGSPSGYSLTRSLRLRASGTAYLARTPSASNRKTWAVSMWVKVGTPGYLFSVGAAGTDYLSIYNFSGGLLVYNVAASAANMQVSSPALLRDYSACYHLVVAVDTTQATSTNRVKMWINGIAQTLTFAITPTLNLDTNINRNVQHQIGCTSLGAPANFYDGLIAEVNFIDGGTPTNTDFGEFDAVTGVWKPKQYTGSYGTNGYYLPFTDNTALTTASNVGLGKDFSGNGNYWTTNNISITAGATYDSFTDVPTLTSATASNFATLNPLDKGANIALSNGNLTAVNGAATADVARSTIGVSSGKWYWEITVGAIFGNAGIANSSAPINVYLGSDTNGWAYNSLSGGIIYNTVVSGTNATWMTAGDVIGFALDLGAGTLKFYKNGALQPSSFSGIPAGTYHAAIGTSANGTNHFNFGQRPFAYTPPTGFVALNTFNLPAPAIVNGSQYFDATTFVGNAGVQTIVNSAGMAPDLVWTKSRGSAFQHLLYDTTRGVNTYLISDKTSAEATTAQTLTAFNSNGFTLGANDSANFNNASTAIAWQWKKGATPGFDVVAYTGNGGALTVPHGLGVTPAMYITKGRGGASNWVVYNKNIGNNILRLNTTDASIANSAFFASAPNSSNFYPSISGDVNSSGMSYIAYLWAEIAGFSKFTSIVGNASADGVFCYLGFKPKMILVKCSTAAGNWYMFDTSRDNYNVAGKQLYPNLSNAETTVATLDVLSNGFKMRLTGDPNAAQTYIVAAWAETPFKNSLAF